MSVAVVAEPSAWDAWSDRSTVTDHVSGSLSALDAQVVAAVPPGGNWRDLPDDFPSRRIQQIRESAAAGEGSRSTYYGRLRWDAPSYTISTYITRPGNGCFIHPSAPRLITIREAARLQGFPDTCEFRGTLRQRAMQIGNAVPPLLAYQVAQELAPGSAADLFAGVGGLSIGLKLAGHDVVLAADNDEVALGAYDANVGDHAVVADLSDPRIRASVVAAIGRAAGNDLGLLAGGPPCQGFSTAGPCLADDPRNQLVHAFVEAAEKLRPRYVLMENVLALAQSRGRRHLEEVRARLHTAGYVTDVAVLHAEGYGVPQRRRRVILLGSRSGAPSWPKPWFTLAEPHFASSQPHQVPAGRPALTVADAISDLPETVAETLDTRTSLNEAASSFQRWVRGEISVTDFVR